MTMEFEDSTDAVRIVRDLLERLEKLEEFDVWGVYEVEIVGDRVDVNLRLEMPRPNDLPPLST